MTDALFGQFYLKDRIYIYSIYIYILTFGEIVVHSHCVFNYSHSTWKSDVCGLHLGGHLLFCLGQLFLVESMEGHRLLPVITLWENSFLNDSMINDNMPGKSWDHAWVEICNSLSAFNSCVPEFVYFITKKKKKNEEQGKSPWALWWSILLFIYVWKFCISLPPRRTAWAFHLIWLRKHEKPQESPLSRKDL